MQLKNKKGFTIIELIVVMAMISVLVLLAVPKFMGHSEQARLTLMKNDIKEIETQYNKHAGQIIGVIVNEYTVDEDTEDTYGSVTNPKRDIADQSGNHRDVQSIPSYIKIRKLKLKQSGE